MHSHIWKTFLLQVLRTKCFSAVHLYILKLLSFFQILQSWLCQCSSTSAPSEFPDRGWLFSSKCFLGNKELDKATRFDKDNSSGSVWVLAVSQDNSCYIWHEDTCGTICIIIARLYVAWLLLTQTSDLWYCWENLAGGEGQGKPLLVFKSLVMFNNGAW